MAFDEISDRKNMLVGDDGRHKAMWCRLQHTLKTLEMEPETNALWGRNEKEENLIFNSPKKKLRREP